MSNGKRFGFILFAQSCGRRRRRRPHRSSRGRQPPSPAFRALHHHPYSSSNRVLSPYAAAGVAVLEDRMRPLRSMEPRRWLYTSRILIQ